MNEKLIEMALDACVLTYVDHETPRHYYISPAADLIDLNDFVKLIIQECAEVADDNYNKGFSPVGGFIRERFGLK